MSYLFRLLCLVVIGAYIAAALSLVMLGPLYMLGLK